MNFTETDNLRGTRRLKVVPYAIHCARCESC